MEEISLQPMTKEITASEKVADVIEKSIGDPWGWTSLGQMGIGSGTVDSLGRIPEPDSFDLLAGIQRDTANTCSDLISDNAAKATCHLYVGQLEGYPEPKSRRKAIT